MMQHIGITNPVHSRINRYSEQTQISHPSRPRSESRDHFSAGQGFDEDEVGHDGEDVVVGGKGSEPVDGEVADPDEEDGDVDGENPEHEE